MKITLPDSSFITYSIEDGELIIENIKAVTPRQGIGSKLVRKVLEIASQESLPCTVFTCPQDDSIDVDSLINFYESLGFEIIQDSYRDSFGVKMKH
jgi:predicted GNAT family N-acyltransferase